MLVTRGTLHVGDALVAGMAYGRVRAMLDPKGNPVEVAGPSDPVEILGLQSVPMAGDEFRVFQDDRDARDLADQRALKARIEEQNRVKHVTLENLFDTMADAEVKELNLIIKADVQGSIEALQDSLDKMDQSEVRINTIHAAVGAITETDVTLADASNAIIIGFGVRPDAKARTAAEREGVEIRTYSVIYKAIEDIDAARIGMLKPTEEEVQTGVAEVRDTFKVPKVGIAAGCMIAEGEVSRDDQVASSAALAWRTSRTSTPATRSRRTASKRSRARSREAHMKQNQHSRRTNEIAREKLATIMLFEVSDPDLQLVTVTGVEVSVDKSFMRAYVSCDASRYEEVSAALERAKGRIRSLLGHALGWRVTPELAFQIDTTTDEAERISRALENVPPTLGVEKDENGYPIAADAEDGASDAVDGEEGE